MHRANRHPLRGYPARRTEERGLSCRLAHHPAPRSEGRRAGDKGLALATRDFARYRSWALQRRCGAEINGEGAGQAGQVDRVVDDDAQLAVLIERGGGEILRPDEGALAVGDNQLGVDVETAREPDRDPGGGQRIDLGAKIRGRRDYDADAHATL